MYKIIIIIVVIIILFYCIKSPFKVITVNDDLLNLIEQSLYNGNQLDGYRLADCIMYPDYFTRSNTIKDVVGLLYKYPNTICDKYIKTTFPIFQEIKNKYDAYDYLTNHRYDNFKNDMNKGIKDIKINIDLIYKLIQEKDNAKSPLKTNDLVLHIRVGDVMCNHKFGNRYSKKNNVSWWAMVVNYIIFNNIKNVYIMSGSHFNECIKESAEYLLNRRNFLLKNSDVSYIYFVLGNPPDDDLIFASKTYHFITTGGGYGFFIGNIIKKLGKGKFVLYNPEKSGLRFELDVFN